MASKRNKMHKLRLKKRGKHTNKGKIIHRLKAKPYMQKTTKRRYNKHMR